MISITILFILVIRVKIVHYSSHNVLQDGSDKMSDIELEENAAYGPIAVRNVR